MEGGHEDKGDVKRAELIWAVACSHQVQEFHVILLYLFTAFIVLFLLIVILFIILGEHPFYKFSSRF